MGFKEADDLTFFSRFVSYVLSEILSRGEVLFGPKDT
jgi:hypothetical protein